jgi:4-hydroxy-tetrahydrodipicolinate synthase
MSFKGSGVALVTPFKSDGEVDFEGLKRLINHVSDNGIDYLVILGTTAETATLTQEEQEQVVQFIIENNAKNLPLVLGLGGNNTKGIIDKINSTDLSPFSAILSVSPYYNKPTQEGIYQHYAAIAAVCPIDIILYNVPGRTSSNMEAKTVKRLADDFDNIVAIKEAAGNMLQFMSLLKDKKEGFDVISGDDALAMPTTLLGGSGVISVIGQALPKDFSKMINSALEGDLQTANELHFKLMELSELIFEEGNPAGVKYLLNKLEISSEIVRLPLISCTNSLRNKIDDAFLRYNTK